MNNFIFNLRESLMAIGAIAELRRDVRGTALRIAAVVLALCILIPLGALDYELYFRVFEFMVGIGGDYWSPRLMGMTPAIMLIGFHLLANKSPNHPVVRLVGALAAYFILAFVLGGGLYIAAMLYLDAGAPSQQAPPLPTLGDLPAIAESGPDQSWLDALFANITSPAGVLALSLGIGGLSVVSVYAGHQLITVIEKNLSEVFAAQRLLREGLGHYRASQEAEARFAVLADEHERLMLCGDDQLLVRIAGLVLHTINTHAITHEKRLQHMRFAAPETLLQQDHSAEIGRVEAALKHIRVLSLKDVLNALSSVDNTRKSK